MTDVSAQPSLQQRPTTLRMTYDEYLAWADEHMHVEWKDGEAIIVMPPKKHHQRVVQFLSTLLGLFVGMLGTGRVGIAPFEVRLGPDGPSREPDLFFVATAGLGRWTDDRLEGGPDLAIEVISNDSVGRDRGDKFYEYQEAGVREYWIIDPRPGKERADFYILDAANRFQPCCRTPKASFTRWSCQALPSVSIGSGKTRRPSRSAPCSRWLPRLLRLWKPSGGFLANPPFVNPRAESACLGKGSEARCGLLGGDIALRLG